MKTLNNWTAKRAGGRITILHDDGKVPHVDKIVCKDGRVVATDARGEEYELALASQASAARP